MTMYLLQLIAEVMVGVSVMAIPRIGLWFIIPWIIGWDLFTFAVTH